jgi:hypothetical protein
VAANTGSSSELVEPVVALPRRAPRMTPAIPASRPENKNDAIR